MTINNLKNLQLTIKKFTTIYMKLNTIIYYSLFAMLFTACNTKTSNETAKIEKIIMQKSPDFNADSAYSFVAKQVEFGKRIPNTSSHIACGNYLAATFRSFGWTVIEQNFEVQAFDGKTLKSRNIIASWKPEISTRILLAAHWDTRPFADQEKDEKLKNQPIDGANDGGSGVGILLEIARTMAQNQAITSKVGVDIILFDSEDYGQPEGTSSENYKQDLRYVKKFIILNI